MSSNKVLFAVYTEYQLILTINEIQTANYINKDAEIILLIKNIKEMKRLDLQFNFEDLNVKIIEWKHSFEYHSKMKADFRNDLNDIIDIKPDVFVFFQENDPLAVVLSQSFSDIGSKIYLFQDGLKPYNRMKSPSKGQMLGDWKQNQWFRKNGYKIKNYFSFLKCHKYGFLKTTQKLFLTFPETYLNWNKKPIEKINIVKNDKLQKSLEKIFNWKPEYLNQQEDAIFFVSQFMRDDGTFEMKLIQYLIDKFPSKPIYIKFHPLSLQFDKNFIEKVKQLQVKHPITIIDARVPAELFIMNLKNSIIVSTISTSMFLDNSSCRFYYTYELAKPYIPRFNRYHVMNPTPHVKTVLDFEEII